MSGSPPRSVGGNVEVGRNEDMEELTEVGG